MNKWRITIVDEEGRVYPVVVRGSDSLDARMEAKRKLADSWGTHRWRTIKVQGPFIKQEVA